MVKKLSVALCGLLVCSLLFSACSTPYMTKGRMARTKKGDSYTLYANEEKPLAGLYFQQHASTPSLPVSVEETLTLSSIKNGKSYKSIVYLDVFSVRNWIGIDGSIEIPLFLAISRIKHFGFSVLTFEDDKLIYSGELEDYLRSDDEILNKAGAEVVEFINKTYLN
jgi:hypothetical protein